MERITIAQLEGLRDVMSRAMERPPFHRVGGVYQIGALLIERGSRTNGITWKLVEITTLGGGENDLLKAWSSRELYDLMHAYRAGYAAAKRGEV